MPSLNEILDGSYGDMLERKRKEQTRAQDVQHMGVLTGELRKERDADLARGRARGEELFADGSLGRIGQGRAADFADIIARRRAFLTGYSPEEMGAMRDQFASAHDLSTSTALRRLQGQQNRSGVRGPVAGAQAGRLISEAQKAETANEQQLFVKQIDAKRGALGDYEKALGDEMERDKFNLGQSAREKMGRIGAELGYGSLGATDRGYAIQSITGERQVEAAKLAAASGGKK